MAKPIYRRVVVKVSGEALMGPDGFGIHQPTLERIAADLVATQRARRRHRRRGRRRQHLPRREGLRAGHSARHRRHDGHAGDRHERARARGARSSGPGAGAHHVGAGHAGGLRDLRAAAGAAPSRRGPHGPARGRHRQSVLHHRHHRGAAGRRDRRRGGAQGDRRRRGLQRRSQDGQERQALRPADPPGGDRARPQGHGCHRLRACPGKSYAYHRVLDPDDGSDRGGAAGGGARHRRRS